MRVLLAFPPSLLEPLTAHGVNNYPPLALYLLASVLERAGIEPVLLDPAWFIDHSRDGELVLDDTILTDIDAVGISANSFNWPLAKTTIQRIKGLRQDMPVIVGGIHVTHFDEHVLATTPADFVVRGEGEVTLLNLLRWLQRPTSTPAIAGISYRDASGVFRRNADATLLTELQYQELPEPALEKVPKGRYLSPLLETSRGCLYRCTFCGTMHHGTWRALDAEQSVERFSHVLAVSDGKYHIPNTVVLVDDCFTRDTRRTIQILRRIPEVAPRLRFDLEGRITDLKEAEVREAIPFKQIHRFLVGIEAGYDEGLRRIRKGFTIKQTERIFSELQSPELAASLLCAFVVGFPWEGEQECLATIRFAAKLVQEYGVQCRTAWHALVPSPLWSERKSFGIDVDPSFFDQPRWSADPNLDASQEANFYRVHPRITPSAYRRINDYIAAYKSMGVDLVDAS